MDLMGFSAAMAQRGCTGSENNFYGSYKGVPFTIVYVQGKPGGKTVAHLAVKFEENISSKMIRHLRKTFKPYVNMGQSASASQILLFGYLGATLMNKNATMNGSLHLSITTKDSQTFAQVLDGLLEEIAKTAPSFGMHIPTLCPLCGAPGCDSYAYMNKAYHPTHAVCVQSMAAVTHAKAAENQQNGSYLTGFIGAVLGALVGLIPNLITYFYLDYAFALLYALIPLASYYGYKLLRGKMTGVATAIIAVVTILAAPFVDIFGLSLYLLAEGYVFTTAELISLLFEPEVLGSMVISFIFALIGLFIVSGIIRRGNKHVVNDSILTQSTLRPMQHLQPATPVAQPVAYAPLEVQPQNPPPNIPQ